MVTMEVWIYLDTQPNPHYSADSYQAITARNIERK